MQVLNHSHFSLDQGSTEFDGGGDLLFRMAGGNEEAKPFGSLWNSRVANRLHVNAALVELASHMHGLEQVAHETIGTTADSPVASIVLSPAALARSRNCLLRA